MVGLEHALHDVTPASQMRLGSLMGAAVWALFFAFALVVELTLLRFPQFRAMSALLASGILLNLALAGFADIWAGWRPSVYVYEVLNALLLTLVIAFTGGSLDLSILFVAYGFFVIHTWVMRPDASVYVTATACGLCYAALGVAEAWGAVTVPVLHRPPTPGERAAVAAFGLLALNSLGLYASRYSAELRRLGERLQALVAERTRELAAVNTALESKARALEAKQQELEEFVYRITHDLKTPVNNVLLFADLLLEAPHHALSDEVRNRLERIRQGSSRAEAMIQDLWRSVQVTSEAETPGWLDLDAIVSRAVESLEATIEAKGICVHVGPLPKSWGCENQLEHVVANLLANAVRYVPSSGGEIEVSGRVEAGCSIFSVRDSGVGIPPEYHQRIFELYGQVPGQHNSHDGDHRGTGVGLAIVKRIVEAHGGTVWVESAPGRGSRFWIRLPLPGDEIAERRP